MAKAHPFHSIHSHGLIRVGAATPRATVGDCAANAAATIALTEQGHAQGADLLVFPELNLTSYAIDDLHLQTAQQRATEAAVAAVRSALKAAHPYEEPAWDLAACLHKPDETKNLSPTSC